MTTMQPLTATVSPLWEALDQCKIDLLQAADVNNVSPALMFSVMRDWADRNLQAEIPQ